MLVLKVPIILGFDTLHLGVKCKHNPANQQHKLFSYITQQDKAPGMDLELRAKFDESCLDQKFRIKVLKNHMGVLDRHDHLQKNSTAATV